MKHLMRRAATGGFAVCAAIVALNIACTGTSGSTEPETNPGPSPEPEPEDCPACAEWPAEWGDAESGMLTAVNVVRATGYNCPNGYRDATGPLTMSEGLQTASRRHAYDMASRGYFSHTSQDGRSPWDRIDDAGYDAQARAENIAAGNGDVDVTLGQWLTSGGHCDNIMLSDVNEMGAGYVFVENAPFGHYWVQTFGAR